MFFTVVELFASTTFSYDIISRSSVYSYGLVCVVLSSLVATACITMITTAMGSRLDSYQVTTTNTNTNTNTMDSSAHYKVQLSAGCWGWHGLRIGLMIALTVGPLIQVGVLSIYTYIYILKSCISMQ